LGVLRQRRQEVIWRQPAKSMYQQFVWRVYLDIKDILKKVDHTLLLQTATEKEILTLLDEGRIYGVASCCIPPSYVKMAKEYVGSDVPVCTVIGFPNGYQTTTIKVFEADNALTYGADEIDMVINIGRFKNGEYSYVLDEIKQIKKACGNQILKVIVETCLLSPAEKTEVCHIITESGADYIKTSTGFSHGGATFDDIDLFRATVGKHVKIKASGGVSSMEDAIKFIELGADRLGTSRLVKIAKAEGVSYDI